MLAERGHAVFVIDYDNKWSKCDTWDLVSKYQEVDIACPDPKSSVRLIHPTFIKVPVLSRASAWASHWQAIEQTIIGRNIDVIILYSVPTNGIQTIRIAKKHGIPVVFRSIDTLNQLVRNSLLSKVTKRMERYVYSHSDLILTISPALSRYVADMGANWNRVRLLPLGVDTNIFRPDIDTTGLRKEWQIDNADKVIIFVGTLPLFSGLDRFIMAFRTIVDEVPEAKLIIVGDGIQRYELERLRYDLGKDWNRVTITGYQPFELIPEFINLATVCISPFDVCGATRDIFPTKIIQYLACGKPVVSSMLPGIQESVREYINGIIYANGKSSDWTNKVVDLLKSLVKCHVAGQSGLKYVKQVHDYNKIIDQLEMELEQL
jgi:glycosyltransferase involved in cell wall biosynthesis